MSARTSARISPLLLSDQIRRGWKGVCWLWCGVVCALVSKIFVFVSSPINFPAKELGEHNVGFGGFEDLQCCE